MPRISPAEIFPTVPPIAPIPVVDDPQHQLVRHGVLITFEEDITGKFAQYANGDYALKLPLTITLIQPSSRNAGGRISHGAEINPTPLHWTGTFAPQGFESSLRYSMSIQGAAYSQELNVAYNIGVDEGSGPKKYEITTPGSLVTCRSRGAAGVRPGLESAVVWTFVEDLPASGAFRPPYATQDAKVSLYNTSDIDYTLLRSLDRTETPLAPQDLDNPEVLDRFEQFTAYFERVWLDHVPEFLVRTFHPLLNMPDYGAFMCELLGQALCLLQLDYTDEEKEPLLINLIQIGIDMHGCLRECRLSGPSSGGASGGYEMWPIGGGHGSGRVMPILFAGFMLGSDEMKNIRTLYGQEDFNELTGQTFWLQKNAGVWNRNHGRYDPAATEPPHPEVPLALCPNGSVNFAEWGNQHSKRAVPYIGPAPDPTASQGMAQDDGRIKNGVAFPNGEPKIWNKHLEYRRADTANSWWGHAAAALVMDENCPAPTGPGKAGCDIVAKVNWNQYFLYLERYDDVVLGGGPAFSYPGALQHEILGVDLPNQSPNYHKFTRQFWKQWAEGMCPSTPTPQP